MVSMGLARLAADRSMPIQTFKKGPDYIDPQWLKMASGRACYNLDPYLQDKSDLEALYRKHASSCVMVEGTMGLHDGLALDGSDSNAAVAKMLGLPVLLVIDCRGMHRTIAPLLNGIMQFDSQLAFSGIVLNRIRSERHAGKIERAIAEYCDAQVLGVVPELRGLTIDERELGLVPASENHEANGFIDHVAQTLAESCDIESILKPNCAVAQQAPPSFQAASGTANNPDVATASKGKSDSTPLANISGVNNNADYAGLRIGIAKDEAFHFYYADDLDCFKERSVELIEFSPLRDPLPENLDGLLLGGGFPERYLAALSENTMCRDAIATAIENGLPVKAECGGLMYLCHSINVKNVVWPMVGAIPGSVSMQKKPVGRGYMQVSVNAEGPSAHLVPKGPMPAHEFHHSSIAFDSQPECAFIVKRGHGIDGHIDGVQVNNVVASYAHFRHSARSPWIDWFLNTVQAQKQRQSQTIIHV